MASTVKLDNLAELGLEEPNRFHIQESYLRQVANGKPFTAKKKNKSRVEGSTAKIYRQKGTGRARQGERKNPHFVGGGLAFPPMPRLQNKKLNKHVRRSAVRSAVLWHIQNGSAWRIDGSDFDGFAKTKDVATLLGGVGSGPVSLVIPQGADVKRACRNIGRVRLLTPETLNVRDLMDSESIIFSGSALDEYRQLLVQQNTPEDETLEAAPAAEAPAKKTRANKEEAAPAATEETGDTTGSGEEEA
jgi:large subunit ribosomal protein L4